MELGPWRKDKEAHKTMITTITMTPPGTTETKSKGRPAGERSWTPAKTSWPTWTEKWPKRKWTMTGAPSRDPEGVCGGVRCSFQSCIVGSSRIMAGIPTFLTCLEPKLVHNWDCLSDLYLLAAMQHSRQSRGLNTAAGWMDRQAKTLCKSLSQDSVAMNPWKTASSSSLQPPPPPAPRPLCQSLKSQALEARGPHQCASHKSHVVIIQAMRGLDERTLRKSIVTNTIVSHVLAAGIVWDPTLWRFIPSEEGVLCKETFWAYQGRGEVSFQPTEK